MAYTDNNGIILNKGLTIAQFNQKVADGTISSNDVATQLFDLSDDLPVSQTEKNAWNSKSNFSGSYNDLTDKPAIPTIPTNVSSFTNDAGYLTEVPSQYITETEMNNAISGKANSSDIPTKVSDLTNDSGFITNTVNNLTNYYKKDETFTKAEVNSLINGITTMNLSIVTSLPTSNISNTTIYLVPKATSGTLNVYDEYLYINSAWEKIGDTEINLANYALKTEIPTKTSQLTNDSNLVVDASYVHTDNNYSNDEKAKVTANTNARHTHTNKTILDNTTASFTTNLETKLNNVATGAEVNVIESVKVNGVVQTVTNKSIDINVPTAITRVWS